jgi:hypothetical protein
MATTTERHGDGSTTTRNDSGGSETRESNGDIRHESHRDHSTPGLDSIPFARDFFREDRVTTTDGHGNTLSHDRLKR